MKNTIFLSALAIIPCLVSAQEKPSQERLLMVGAGAMVAPRYAGSNALETQAIPIVIYRETFNNKHTFSFEGIGGAYDYALNDRVSIGLAAKYKGERETNDDAELSGLPEIDGTIELGPKASYALSPKTSAEVGAFFDVGDAHSGYTINAGLSHRERVSNRLMLNGKIGVTYASDDYNQAYFNVPTAQARSDRPAYQTDGGFHSINLSGIATYQLQNNWHGFGLVQADVLVGDAADSPLVESAFQPRAILGISYKF